MLHGLAFIVAFYGTFLIGLSGWVLLFHRISKVNQRYLRYIILLTIGLLIWFGTSLILSAVSLSAYHPVLMLGLLVIGVIGRYRFSQMFG